MEMESAIRRMDDSELIHSPAYVKLEESSDENELAGDIKRISSSSRVNFSKLSKKE
jgi:hypothetical protein